MAEVTGNLNGEPIELNNAATEATLKQLLAAMLSMAAAKGLSKKAQQELEKTLEALNKEAQKLKDKLKEENPERKKGIAGLKDSAKQVEKFSDSVGNAATSLIKDLAGLGNSLSSAAQSLKAIPVVGGMLSTTFGAVAGAAERSYKAFQDSASVGANFGGSITEMINAASGAGLTIDQFSGVVAKNGQALALLGQGSNDGAKRLAQLGKAIRESGTTDELYRMGYSTEDINNGMAQFAGRLAKGGALQTMTTAQIAKVTGSYLRELDAVAKLTGQSKEALQEQENARMRDAQYLNLKNKLDAEGQKNLELLMSSIPEGMQAGAKEVLATGTATSEAGEQFLAFMKQSGMSLTTLGQDMRKTGKLSLDSVVSNSRIMQKEGAALAKSPIGDTLSNFLPEFNNLMVSANELGARQTDLGKTIEENNEIARKRKEREQELLDKGLDPASMEKYKQQIAETSNEFTKVLANSGLLQVMLDAFKMLADFTTAFVVPAFQLLGAGLQMLSPVFQYLGDVMYDVSDFLIDSFYNVTDFISDNLEPILAVFGGALAVLAYKSIPATIAAIPPLIASLVSQMAATWGVVAPMLAVAAAAVVAAAPFIAVAAAAGLIVWGFKKLGGDMSVVTDGLKYMWSGFKSFFSYLKLGFYQVLDALPGVDFGEEIKSTQKEILDQQLDREKLANKMSETMAANRKAAEEEEKKKEVERDRRDEKRSRERHERDRKRIDDRAAREAAIDKEKEEKAKGIDYGNTLSILKDQQRAQAQPGAVTAQPGGAASVTPSGPIEMPDTAPADIQKYLQATALIESGGNANARAGTSSAGGMFQFLDSTWKQMVKEMGKDYKLEDKFDPKKASEVMAYFTQKQKAQLEKGIGRQASNTDLYMSHFLGAGGATKFLNAMQKDPTQSAAALDPAAAKANASIYYDKGRERSLQEVYALMGKKMAKAESAVAEGKWGGKALPEAVAALAGNKQINAGQNAPTGTPVSRSKLVTPAQPLNNAEVIKQAQEKYKAEKAAEEAKKKEEEAKKTPTTAPSVPTQESAESLLASLNNKMDQLIKYTAQTTTNTYQQVVATKGLSTDVFNAV